MRNAILRQRRDSIRKTEAFIINKAKVANRVNGVE